MLTFSRLEKRSPGLFLLAVFPKAFPIKYKFVEASHSLPCPIFVWPFLAFHFLQVSLTKGSLFLYDFAWLHFLLRLLQYRICCNTLFVLLCMFSIFRTFFQFTGSGFFEWTLQVYLSCIHGKGFAVSVFSAMIEKRIAVPADIVLFYRTNNVMPRYFNIHSCSSEQQFRAPVSSL